MHVCTCMSVISVSSCYFYLFSRSRKLLSAALTLSHSFREKWCFFFQVPNGKTPERTLKALIWVTGQFPYYSSQESEDIQLLLEEETVPSKKSFTLSRSGRIPGRWNNGCPPWENGHINSVFHGIGIISVTSLNYRAASLVLLLISAKITVLENRKAFPIPSIVRCLRQWRSVCCLHKQRKPIRTSSLCLCFSATKYFSDPGLGEELHNGPQRNSKKFGFSFASYLHLAHSPLPRLASSMSFHVPIYNSHLSPALEPDLLLSPCLSERAECFGYPEIEFRGDPVVRGNMWCGSIQLQKLFLLLQVTSLSRTEGLLKATSSFNIQMQ